MIVLYQTNLHGHRAEYLDHAIKWAEKRNEEVVVWVKDCLPADAKIRFPKNQCVQDVLTGPMRLVYLEELNENYKKIRLVFLDGDRELAFGLRNFVRLSKFKPTYLLMRLNMPVQISASELFVFSLKFAIAFALQLSGAVHIKRLVFLQKAKMHIFSQVRDPLPGRLSETSLRATESNSIKEVGIVGTLDERKSIGLAISSLPKLGSSVTLNLVGQVTANYKESLQKLVHSSHSVRLLDKHLSDDELVREISNLDCFLVLQQVNAPSGTILRALDCGIPVVVGGSRVLKLAVRKYPNLVTWTKLREDDLATAIKTALSKTRSRASGLPTPMNFAIDLLGEIDD